MLWIAIPHPSLSEAKAILVPWGRQTGLTAHPIAFVVNDQRNSASRVAESMIMIQIAYSPPLVSIRLIRAIFVPSGDQDGRRSSRLLGHVSFAGSEPSAFMVHTSRAE